MLDRILTASRTVERPTPKICINSGSGGSFSPTSNFPDMNCSCNRPASSSASDFLLSCMFEPGFIISSDVLCESRHLFRADKIFRDILRAEEGLAIFAPADS